MAGEWRVKCAAGEMRRIAGGAQIDLPTWGDIIDQDDRIIRSTVQTLVARVHEMFSGAVAIMMERYPPKLSFPFGWSSSGHDGFGGPVPDDPATVYVELGLGGSDDPVCYGGSLEDAVDQVIDSHIDVIKSGKIHTKEGVSICLAIAGRLRELADKLEDACVDIENAVDPDDRDAAPE